ncbi:MAG TPA: DNA polymerase III subunit gamma and tau [Streptosporangiaceae bacterium]
MAGDAPGTAHGNPAQPGPAAPLALYRKYRPASFAEVKGQEHVTEPLRQALLNGRIHHAYLFSGPRGCGKTSSARILARSLNCEQGPTPDPCGVCPSCVALAPQGPGSIDVIEIDAASHGGVDDARDLRERAFYAPVSGRFKIYIIDEAHMVTREGFNALLKLVEEPPPHLKFVFATTEPEKVIATIRSRTHHYPFRLVPPAVLRELLEEILAAEQVSYQPAVLPLVVRAGAGSVRDALSILDQLLAGSGPEGLVYDRTVALLGYSDDSVLDEMVGAFAAGTGAAVFQAVDKVVEGGHDPRRFAADLLDRLRDLIILAAVPGAGQSGLLDAPADRLERMAEQAGRFGQAELTRAADILSEGLIQMRGTTSPRLLLELMCAQVLLPAASTGEKALLARLERLEHQLAGLGPGGPAPAGGPPRPDRDAGERAPAAPQQAASQQAASQQAASPPAASQQAASPPGASPPGASQRAASPPAASQAAGPPKEGSRPAGSQQAGPGHPGPEPASKARADTETFRERWPEILDAVREERKVAWILLRNTSAESFEGSVLTVAFGSEGEARSFASSGHEAVLVGAVTTLLGVNVRVRPVAAGAGSPGRPAARPGGTPPVPDAPPRATPAATDAADPPAADAARAPASKPAAHATGEPGAGPGEAPSAGDAGHPPAPAPGTGRASRPASAAGGSGDRRSTKPGASRTGSGRRQPATASSSPAGSAAEEPWPDEDGDPGDTGLSGMDLIARQLGGQVIEEIDES